MKGPYHAASVLVTAVVGMTAGLRYYLLVCRTTTMIFLVLHVLAG